MATHQAFVWYWATTKSAMKVLCSYEVMVTRWCGEHKTSASANVAATTVFAQNTCPSSDA